MSILDTPRFNFTGIFYCNPCTNNNDDVLPDVVVRDTSTLGSSIVGQGTDDQMRAYLATAEQRSDYFVPPNPPPDCKVFLNGGWNPYGNHWCNFMNAAIQTGVSSLNSSGPVPISDSSIGMSVKLLGSKSSSGIPSGDPVMVDMDSTGLVTTQIFVGGIQIGDPNNGGVIIQADATAYQSWLNFNATVAENGYGGEQNFVGIGCMMQFVLPGYLVPDPTPSMPASLQQLLTLAKQDLNGIVVRFQIFEVEPGYTDQYLGNKFAKGQRLANMAYGYGVGTIGVYYFNEPTSEPEGRKLMAPYWPGSGRPDMFWSAPYAGAPFQKLPGCPLPWEGPPALIGNVVCVVNACGVISLDLSSAFAKYGYRNPNGPQHENPPEGFDQPLVGADMGDLQLYYLQAGTNNPIYIGTIVYGYGSNLEDFRNGGCIQDMVFDASLYDDIQAGTLFIMGNPNDGSRPNSNVTVVTERADGKRVMVEPRTSFVGVPGDAALVGFRLRERGGPPTTPTTLYMFEYMNIIEDGPMNTSCGDNYARPNQSTAQRTSGCFSFPSQITLTNQSGYTSPVYIQANAIQPGVSMITFQLDDVVMGSSVPAWSGFDWSTLRIYTDDDYSAQIAAGLTWDFVYAEVLQFYYVLYPAMTQYVKLNNRCAVYAARQAIREMMVMPSQLPAFKRTFNMPVTRTLSPGKINLLMAWLDQEEADPNCPCKNQT